LNPQYNTKNIDKLEQVQQRAIMLVRRVEYKPCEKKLREEGLVVLEKRRHWKNLTAAFHFLSGH